MPNQPRISELTIIDLIAFTRHFKFKCIFEIDDKYYDLKTQLTCLSYRRDALQSLGASLQCPLFKYMSNKNPRNFLTLQGFFTQKN